jgi:hypothetical protein
MKWLPYESWEVRTPLGRADLVTALRARVDPARWAPWKSRTLFWGRITTRGFMISRRAWQSLALQPVLYGKFLPAESGASVHVRMMPHPVAILVLGAWLVGLCLCGALALVSPEQIKSWPGMIQLGAMVVFGFVALYGSFWAYAPEAKRECVDLIEHLPEPRESPTGPRP